MKKIIAMIFVFVMIGVVASAEIIDFSNYSIEDLSEIHREIIEEISKRSVSSGYIIYQGDYPVDIAIQSGSYTLTRMDANNNEKYVEVRVKNSSGEVVSRYPLHENEKCTVCLVEGDTLTVAYGSCFIEKAISSII